MKWRGVYETTIAQSDADDTAYGDLNTDNKVDLRDIIVLNKYLANMIQLSDTQMEMPIVTKMAAWMKKMRPL